MLSLIIAAALSQAPAEPQTREVHVRTEVRRVHVHRTEVLTPKQVTVYEWTPGVEVLIEKAVKPRCDRSGASCPVHGTKAEAKPAAPSEKPAPVPAAK